MPTDAKNIFNIDYSQSERGAWAADTPIRRPEVPRISTLDDSEANVLLSHEDGLLSTFGAALGSLDDDEGRGLRTESVGFKAASAPDSTNAFPSHLTEDRMSMSPALSFLSMFSPVAIQEELPDTDGQVVAGYTLDSTVGFGGFSTIKKAYSSSGDVVAIKIVKRADLESQPDPVEAVQQLDNERDIWSSLNHEHILPLFVYEHTNYADFFVTLFCPAGSLFDILKRDGNPALPQDDAGTMFRQIVRGLRYLHEVAKIVHRDVKLENIFVDDTGSCRIGDFGLAKRMSELEHTEECRCVSKPEPEDTGRTYDRFRRHTSTEHSNFGPSLHLSLRRPHGPPSRHRSSMPFGDATEVSPKLPAHNFQPGSLPYASPELLSVSSTVKCAAHSAGARSPNPAQDMWALGVVLYALLTGRLPFWDSFEPRLQMKILHGAYDVPVGIGHGAESVLRGCLDRSVSDRWTIDMVDDVAWGVGWGLAGDVSGQNSPIDELSHSGHDFRKSRSRSRARPYPDHPHTVAHVIAHSTSDGLSSAISSTSRSRSRSTRAPSNGRTSSERAPSLISSSMHSSLISEDTPTSPLVGSAHSLSALVSRGRKMQKGVGGGIAVSGVSSGSRSWSRSESPTTPAEAEVVTATYDITSQEPIPVRGRRRDRKSTFGDVQNLDVVQEV